jgi:hypothetical protein
VGYARYETHQALALLNACSDELRLWTNYWQPTLKLVEKTRDDTIGKTTKRYDEAKTPYQRVLAAGVATDATPATLAETFAAVGPPGHASACGGSRRRWNACAATAGHP